MYGAEVFDGETARFEVELSEDDVHGQWKLNGEVLGPSAVCLIKTLLLRFDPLSSGFQSQRTENVISESFCKRMKVNRPRRRSALFSLSTCVSAVCRPSAGRRHRGGRRQTHSDLVQLQSASNRRGGVRRRKRQVFR